MHVWAVMTAFEKAEGPGSISADPTGGDRPGSDIRLGPREPSSAGAYGH
jgi:hypothetical protein